MKADTNQKAEIAISVILDDLRSQIADKLAKELHEFKVAVKAHRIDDSGNITGFVGDDTAPDA